MYGSTKKKTSGFRLSPLEQEEQIALEKKGKKRCSLSLQALNYRELLGLAFQQDEESGQALTGQG